MQYLKLSIQEKLSRQQKECTLSIWVLWILGQLWVISHHLPGSQASHSCKWWVACAGREGRTLKEGQGKLTVEWQEMQHSRALALLFRRYFAPCIIRFLKIPNSFSFGFLIVKINLLLFFNLFHLFIYLSAFLIFAPTSFLIALFTIGLYFINHFKTFLKIGKI